jgi:hypothetical protein
MKETINPIYLSCGHVYCQPTSWDEYHLKRLDEGREAYCSLCNKTVKVSHACAGYGCCSSKRNYLGTSGYSDTGEKV